MVLANNDVTETVVLQESISLESLPMFVVGANSTGIEFNAQSNILQYPLPSGVCPASCLQSVVVINGTDDVDYVIDGKCFIQ